MTCPNCVSRDLITCGTSIETSLVDSPRDRSRFWGPGCVISWDPITEGTSIETSFVDYQSTRRIPVVDFGISSSIGPQSRPCSWIPNPCDRSGLGIWGSLSHMGPQSRPRWWTVHVTGPDFVSRDLITCGTSLVGGLSTPKSIICSSSSDNYVLQSSSFMDARLLHSWIGWPPSWTLHPWRHFWV
jgi:hypothetical protein